VNLERACREADDAGGEPTRLVRERRLTVGTAELDRRH
jgi:hypothetical protein